MRIKEKKQRASLLLIKGRSRCTLQVLKDALRLWRELLSKTNKKKFLMTTDIILTMDLGTTSTNQRLISVFSAESTQKRQRERMSHVSAGTQDTKISLRLVMEIMTSKGKEEVEQFAFIRLRTSSGPSITFQLRKVLCHWTFILRVPRCCVLVFMMGRF